MQNTTPSPDASAHPPPTAPRRFGWPQVLGIVLVTVVVTVAATVWLIRTYVLPAPFTPVVLSPQEMQVVEAKLARLDLPGAYPQQRSPGIGEPDRRAERDRPLIDLDANDGPLVPELYREDPASRTVMFTQRELNGLIARDPNLVGRAAVHLAPGQLSLQMLIPLDPEFPLLGGRNLRVAAGLGLAYADGRPQVVLKGVSLMGVPIPNAWLGGIKNVDLVREFGDEGFWKAVAEGIESVQVQDGRLTLVLRE
ncbi:MAG: hypothetical protein PHQ14_12390 [Chromatiales bacterium]|jgi:hypothetical protein|nr:hypothetical protein [Chromatiales bacterium]MDX9768033.1 hypothetical protein [Ectothiorhodospiraceae bacterium]